MPTDMKGYIDHYRKVVESKKAQKERELKEFKETLKRQKSL